MNEQHPVDNKQIESQFNLLSHPGTQFRTTTRRGLIDGEQFSGGDPRGETAAGAAGWLQRTMQH